MKTHEEQAIDQQIAAKREHLARQWPKQKLTLWPPRVYGGGEIRNYQRAEVVR